MESMFFDGWTGLLRTVVLGVCSYACLVAFLRLSGKRTLAKMNAFDLVVTVALGSTLATILLSEEVSLAEGLLALALLISLQFMIAWLGMRWHGFGRLVKSEPSMLMYRGRFLERAMNRERVSREEVRAAARAAALGDLERAYAVVLETDGSFTVIPEESIGTGSAVEGVRKVEPQPANRDVE